MVKIESVELDRKWKRGLELAAGGFGRVCEAESDTSSCWEWSGSTLAGQETLA